jgi:hypothetical protein
VLISWTSFRIVSASPGHVKVDLRNSKGLIRMNGACVDMRFWIPMREALSTLKVTCISSARKTVILEFEGR